MSTKRHIGKSPRSGSFDNNKKDGDSSAQQRPQEARLVVAAVDFGTTYSGYAFSFRHEYEKDHLKIYANQSWNAGGRGLFSLKAPTTVLFDPQKNFHSFGYQAETKYSDLALDDDHHDWYLFRRFKMILHMHKALKRNVEMKAEDGKTLPAKQVFAVAIEYLKDHLLETLHERTTGVDNKDILWVVTVPAIWNDASKQFMREAAEEAGISNDQLLLALEPEAASLYCKELPVEKMEGADQMSLVTFGTNTKYMVLDLGGGTADITIHEVQSDGNLKELHAATGGAWGGTYIDSEFEQMMTKIVGYPIWQQFIKDQKSDYLELQREFEAKKRTITFDACDKITLRVPVSLVNIYEKAKSGTVELAVQGSSFAGQMTWKGDKIRIDAETFKALFQPVTSSIVNHVKNLFGRKIARDVDTILMVGGLSESPLVREEIRKNFPDKRVIVPEEAGLAVLRGAVIFGHNPRSISTRICKYTYGIEKFTDFIEGVHPPCKKVVIGKFVLCNNYFDKHVESGSRVKVGEPQKAHKYRISSLTQKVLIFPVYASNEKDPKFATDEGCERLGELRVELSNTAKGLETAALVKMTFGDTEVEVEATEEDTGKAVRAYFDFLS